MSDVLNSLYQVLLTRKNASAEESYVASLYQGGVDKMAAKILEEAQEFIVELHTGDRERLRDECADLLFHILVTLAYRDLPLEDVLSTLDGRFGTSGHEEKASRSS